jgi:retron-type reverse transcriptase
VCAATAALRASTASRLAGVEGYGIDRLLGELAAELKERRYRRLPARRVFIPKPGTSEPRPLSIPWCVTGSCRRR